MTFVPRPGQDASASIRGYVYQAEISVLEWIRLAEGARIELELGEDVTEVFDQWARGRLTQVKAMEENLTLRRPYALKFLADSLSHQEAPGNASIDLSFVFLTTAAVGKETGIDLPGGVGAITAWEALRRDELPAADVNGTVLQLRQLLKSAPRPKKCGDDAWQGFQAFLERASEGEFIAFVRKVEWSTRSTDPSLLGGLICSELRSRGLADGPAAANLLYRGLLVHVCRLLSQSGPKRLAREEIPGVLAQGLEEQEEALLERLEADCPSLKVLFSELRQEAQATREVADETRAKVADLSEKIPNAFAAHAERVEEALARQKDDLSGVLRDEIASQLTPYLSSKGDYTSEIDEACEFLKGPEETPTAARALLERLRKHHWDDLTRTEQFRVLANLGHSHLHDNEAPRAAEFYVAAHTLEPENEEAGFLRAFAHLISGEDEAAHKLAGSLRGRYPKNQKLLNIWLRTAPKEVPLGVLREQAAGFEGHVDVCVALSERAFSEGDLDLAEEYARKGLSADPAWSPAYRALGVAILKRETDKVEDPFHIDPPFGDPERLREAVGILSAGLARLSRPVDRRMRGHAFLDRATAFRCLAEDEAMARDIDFAEQLAEETQAPELLGRWANIAQATGRSQRVIDALRRAPSLDDPPFLRLLLAIALAHRNEAKDSEEATQLLEEALRRSSGDQKLQDDCLQNLVELVRLESGWEVVREHVDKRWSGLPLSSAARLSLKSRAARNLGDPATATELAREAASALSEESATGDRRRVAIALSGLGLYAEAVRVWRSFVDTERSGDDLRSLVAAATHAGEDQLVMEIGEGLRKRGIWDRVVFEREISVLQEYDLGRAVELLQEFLEQHPEDRIMRLRLSLAGLRLGREDLQTKEPSELPTIDEVRPELGAMVVSNLKLTGNSKAAADFAYRLLRKHPNSDVAQDVFVQVFLPLGGAEPEFYKPNQVEQDAAVRLELPDQDQPRWFILEGSGDASRLADELAPSDALYQALLGKREGDSFDLPHDPSEGQAKVLEIQHKHTYRFRQTMQDASHSRSRTPAFRQIRVPSPEENPERAAQVLLATLEQFSAQARRADEEFARAWATLPRPVGHLAEARGQSILRTMEYLASQDAVRLLCSTGLAQDRTDALSALQGPAVLADPTALATLWLLDRTEVLRLFPGLVVTQSVLQELRDELLAEQGYGSAQEDRVKSLAALLSTVEDVATSESGRALAELAGDERELLVQVLGHATAESLVVAERLGRVLWTDDLNTARIARSRGVKCVWTQVVLEHLSSHENLAAADFNELSAHLIGMGYDSTSFSLPIAVRAGELAEWDPERRPLRQMIETFAHPSLEAPPFARFLLPFLREAWRRSRLRAESITTVVLHGLGRKPGWDRAVRYLLRNADRAFGVDGYTAELFRSCVQDWFRDEGGSTLWLP